MPLITCAAVDCSSSPFPLPLPSISLPSLRPFGRFASPFYRSLYGLSPSPSPIQPRPLAPQPPTQVILLLQAPRHQVPRSGDLGSAAARDASTHSSPRLSCLLPPPSLPCLLPPPSIPCLLPPPRLPCLLPPPSLPPPLPTPLTPLNILRNPPYQQRDCPSALFIGRTGGPRSIYHKNWTPPRTGHSATSQT